MLLSVLSTLKNLLGIFLNKPKIIFTTLLPISTLSSFLPSAMSMTYPGALKELTINYKINTRKYS